MKQHLAHQILSLSLAALLTAGIVSGMGGLANQQHRSAMLAQASQTLAVAPSPVADTASAQTMVATEQLQRSGS